MKYLGTKKGIGTAWLVILNEIMTNGIEVSNPEETYTECKGISIDITVSNDEDTIIKKYGNQKDIDWMISNFENFQNVVELQSARSYASRLYKYAGKKNQIEWVVQKFKENPNARSATITTFEPLTDVHYIPCVSMLDFDFVDGQLSVYVYARALDFGKKGYANLICIQKILKNIAKELDCDVGTIHLICKSAHVYDDSYSTVNNILRRAFID